MLWQQQQQQAAEDDKEAPKYPSWWNPEPLCGETVDNASSPDYGQAPEWPQPVFQGGDGSRTPLMPPLLANAAALSNMAATQEEQQPSPQPPQQQPEPSDEQEQAAAGRQHDSHTTLVGAASSAGPASPFGQQRDSCTMPVPNPNHTNDDSSEDQVAQSAEAASAAFKCVGLMLPQLVPEDSGPLSMSPSVQQQQQQDQEH